MRDLPILFKTPMIQAILEDRKTQTRRAIKFPLNVLHTTGDPVKLFGDWHLSRIIDFTDGMLRYEVQTEVDDSESGMVKSRYQVGDHLWVREIWRVDEAYDNRPPREIPEGVAIECAVLPEVLYTEGNGHRKLIYAPGKWRAPIHMPKKLARLWLEVTKVRCERLQSITEEDAIKEGVEPLFSPEKVKERSELFSDPMPWLNYLWHGHFGDCGTGNKKSDAWPYQYSSYKKARDSFSSLWELINGPGSWEFNPFVFVYEFRRIEK